MTEYNLKIEFFPESYDYEDGDIVYRVYVGDTTGHWTENKQLIVERKLLKLNNNQRIIENLSFETVLKNIKIMITQESKISVIAKSISINSYRFLCNERFFYTSKNLYFEFVCYN